MVFSFLVLAGLQETLPLHVHVAVELLVHHCLSAVGNVCREDLRLGASVRPLEQGEEKSSDKLEGFAG